VNPLAEQPEKLNSEKQSRILYGEHVCCKHNIDVAQRGNWQKHSINSKIRCVYEVEGCRHVEGELGFELGSAMARMICYAIIITLWILNFQVQLIMHGLNSPIKILFIGLQNNNNFNSLNQLFNNIRKRSRCYGNSACLLARSLASASPNIIIIESLEVTEKS